MYLRPTSVREDSVSHEISYILEIVWFGTGQGIKCNDVRKY